MKQMRSRFRLLTLLLACAFFLVLVLCAGNALRTAGFSLDSLSSLPFVRVSASPEPSPASSATVVPENTEPSPDPSEVSPTESVSPGTDNIPDPQYNTFGL